MAPSSGSNRRFGVVIFDDDKEPGVGWACIAGGKPDRISSADELSTGVIWWSNIKYDFFFSKTEIWRKTWLRHDKYLVVGHADVLREWNYDPKVVEPVFLCSFIATVFDRIMRIAYNLIREVDPRKTMETIFVGKTLRDDLRCVLPEPEYPKSEAASIMKSGLSFEEFTATGMRPPKGAQFIMLRKPRMLYATEMLQIPLPKGPFEHMSRTDLRNQNTDRVALVRDMEQPCMVEIAIEKIAPEIAPIYAFGSATDKDRRTVRSWVSHPEFHMLHRIADIDVRAAWVGREYGSLMGELPDPIKEFLADKKNENSWSAGIVAETIWRAATLKEEKWKAGSLREGEDHAHTSWQGAWMKGADKVSMFLTALDLAKMDYAVLSYGLGWVRCGVPEENIKDFLNDGLSLGLIPTMFDVPEGLYHQEQLVQWGGDKRSHSYAHFLACKKQTLLWNLDRVPTLPESQKKKFIQDLMIKSKQGVI